MKNKYLLAGIIGAVSFPAMAQEQPSTPKFYPYEITQAQHEDLVRVLGEIPAKYAVPILQRLWQLEMAAQTSAKAARSVPPAPAGQ